MMIYDIVQINLGLTNRSDMDIYNLSTMRHMLNKTDIRFYNLSSVINKTTETESTKSGTLFVWYLIGSIVLVMVGVLLLSFYKYHKRIHKNKRHHIDYIRANLPLIRPRISPPTMNSVLTLTYMYPRPTSSGLYTKSNTRSHIMYMSVPMEDSLEDRTDSHLDKQTELIDFNTVNIEINNSDNDDINKSALISTDLNNSREEKPQYVPKFQPFKLDSQKVKSNTQKNIPESEVTCIRVLGDTPFTTGTERKPLFKEGFISADELKLCDLPKTCVQYYNEKRNDEESKV